MDLDLGTNEVGARRVWRDLQAPPLPGDGVVGCDDALLLEAQDVAPLLLCDRHESGPCFGGCDGKARIVDGHVAVANEAICSLQIIDDAGQLQLLRQTILEGAEQPFRAPRASGE